MSFCDGLSASISTNSSPMTGKVDSHKQVIVYKNTKITLFRLDNVVLVHGKRGLVTVGENGLMKSGPFTDPRNYFEDPSHSIVT